MLVTRSCTDQVPAYLSSQDLNIWVVVLMNKFFVYLKSKASYNNNIIEVESYILRPLCCLKETGSVCHWLLAMSYRDQVLAYLSAGGYVL